MRIFETDRFNGTTAEAVSVPDYFDLLARQTAFSDLGAWTGANPTLTGGGEEPERLRVVAMSASLLPALGRRPGLGRGFTAEEDRPGGPPVAILSDGLWKRRFAGDPGVVGRTVLLDGRATTVVGIMPADFRFLQGEVDLWTPLQADPNTGRRGQHNLGVVARLGAGATIDAAGAGIATIMADLERQYHDDNVGRGGRLEPLAASISGAVRPALLLLLGAVGVVLAIACANVANLLFGRGAARRREIAVRGALGAGRGRIVRQLLVESLVLATAGGALGTLFAVGAVGLLRALDPANLPRLAEVSLSVPVLAFALAVTAATGLLFGLLPALQAARTDLVAAIGHGGRTAGGAGGIGGGRVRAALTVAQVALAFVLVVGAGLLIESMWKLTRVEPGFQPDHLARLSIVLPPDRYPSDFHRWPESPEVKAFYAEALAGARRLPGVTAAALAVNSPTDAGWTSRVAVEGGPSTVEEGVEEERIRPVGDGYFATAGIPLLRGRDFGPADDGGPATVIVNEAFVRRYFPAENPLGKRAEFWGRSREIVGVVGDVRFLGLDSPSEPAVYAPLSQLPFASVDLLLRGSAPAAQTIAAMRAEVRRIDPDLAVFGAGSFDQVIAQSLGGRRFNLILLGAFAALALLLAAVGIYGVVAYGVTRRVHEFGVRMSLGADRQRIGRLVLAQAWKLAAAGVIFGVVGALAASRLIAGLLYGVEATNPATLAAVALFLGGVSIVAALVPARRASRVDPATALRRE